MSASTRSPLSTSQRWAYALPALAMALPTLPFYVLLPTYYAETTALNLAQVGVWLMLARLFDVCSDALAARLCDHSLGRLGRKGWIVIGAALAAPGLVGLAIPAREAGAAWLFGCSLMLYTGWTLIQVTYTAWLVSLGSCSAQRLQLSSHREALGMIGLVLSALWPALGGWLGWSQQEVFVYLSLCVIGWGGVSLFWMLRSLPQPYSMNDRRDWRALFRLAPQRRLLLVWGLNGLGNAFAAVLFPLVVTGWLLLPDTHRGAYLLVYFLAALLAMPVWRLLGRRLPQHRIWCLAMIVAIAAFVTLPLLPAQPAYFLFVVLVTGTTLGADLALPHSIQASLVAWEERVYQRYQPALHYAAASMVTKLALGIGVGFAPMLLLLGGWQDGSGYQNQQARATLIMIYAWGPCVFKILAVLLMWQWQNLDESTSQLEKPVDRSGSKHRGICKELAGH